LIWDGCRSQQQKPRHTERCAEEFCLLPGLPVGTAKVVVVAVAAVKALL